MKSIIQKMSAIFCLVLCSSYSINADDIVWGRIYEPALDAITAKPAGGVRVFWLDKSDLKSITNDNGYFSFLVGECNENDSLAISGTESHYCLTILEVGEIDYASLDYYIIPSGNCDTTIIIGTICEEIDLFF